ncbi:hypothetical protein BFJ70_g16640 [Fusarium oxysporum]|nr:hypothetical protein BFJ70_g16640 [Fusarium oxysporum]
MDDAVRISAEKFRAIYEESFITWARLYAHVVGKSRLPAQSFAVHDISQQHPVLSRNMRLKHDQKGAFAIGKSIWSSNGTKCGYELPPFRQPVHIRVAVKNPVSLSISEPNEKNAEPLCFARDCDYTAVLVLAWSYILSARWTEIMPGACSLAYTESQATTHQGITQCKDEENLFSIQIGDISLEEARWWAAILAPGQGWRADITYEQQTFLAPWSIHLQQSPCFVLLHGTDSASSPYPAATFSDASQYLDRFCARYNITNQSQAAMAAVLLLPSMGSLKPLRLPTPRTSNAGAPHLATDVSDNKPYRDRIHKSHHIDRLLTLSCHTRGIRPLLLSAFYEPRIECNAVTPWLQGTLAAIKHVAGNDSYMVGRMCMERSPRVAFLWLGCIILDLQDKLLQEVHFGQIPVDLHSAAWSGTIQSFIQQRVSNPLVTDGYVSRADECRLLFLSQSEHPIRVPMCQWKPFGKTLVEDVDVEVRVHQQCEDHWLQYEGIGWECKDGSLEFQSSRKAGSQNFSGEPLIQHTTDVCPTAIDYGELARDREAISENATRSIFGWLRSDGYAPRERDIWDHEWFNMPESDEDDIGDDVEDGNTTFGTSTGLSPRVESWILDAKASTSDSEASGTHTVVT